MSDRPFGVSIGLPVYNGMPYLEGAIEALLQQDFQGPLEVVICDNASTDATAAVCEAIAGRDPRVRYLRNDSNVGASANFNRAFRESRYEYFSWAAHDDRFEPGYVRRSLAALAAAPASAFCVSSVQTIDEEDQPIEVLAEDSMLESPAIADRLRSFLRRNDWYLLYGLFRADRLDETHLYPPVWGGDVVLLWELLLRHPVVVLSEPLFRYRVYAAKAIDDVLAGILPSANRRTVSWSYVRLWRNLWKAAAAPDLPARTTRVARLELARAGVRSSWRNLFYADVRNELSTTGQPWRRPSTYAFVLLLVVLRPSRAGDALRLRVPKLRSTLHRTSGDRSSDSQHDDERQRSVTTRGDDDR